MPWRVSYDAIPGTTPRSSLLTPPFTTSGSRPKRFVCCCAAPVRPGRSPGSIARSRSPLETLARLDLEAAGLSFEDGVDVEGVGEVDLVVEGRIVVELDGYTYHCDEYQFTLDRWRDRRLIAHGYLPLRFTRKEVYAHQVVPDVLKALDRWKMSESATKAAAGPERLA